MNYYLPIKINARRVHVLKFYEVGHRPQDYAEFSFLIDNKSLTLLSEDIDSPILISDRGRNYNQNLSQYTYQVTRIDDIEDEYNDKGNSVGATYKAKIIKISDYQRILRKNKMEGKAMPNLMISLPHMNPIRDRLTLGFSDNIESSFRLIVEYTDPKSDVTYEASVLFHTYRSDQEFISATIDFGSEASQVRLSTASDNENLVHLFRDITHLSGNAFWQGNTERTDNNPYLFKSIFFINQEPATTCFADEPMKNGNDTFIQILNQRTDNIQNRLIYPNSKLIELVPANKLDLNANVIPFDEDSNIRTVNSSLSDSMMQTNISQMLLGYFLHAIMFKIGRNPICLRIVLLVPNVYHQRKIYTLMTGLMRDFNTIKHNHPEYKVRGIEVEVISESDAAFLGQIGSITNKKNQKILIIDAGKGTTDFSIIKQTGGYSEFRSIYRNGIPASGHALTYSFYEALFYYFKRYNLNIDKILISTLNNSTSRADLLTFIDYMEQLKAGYDVFRKDNIKDIIEPTINDVQSLTNLNTYIRNEFISKKIQIPSIDDFISSNSSKKPTNMEQIVLLLKDQLRNYIGKEQTTFSHVILSGRGFLFKPFQTAIKDMLVENHWVGNKDDIHIVPSNAAKSTCVSGAFQLSGAKRVNDNSGLIGDIIFRYKRLFFGEKKSSINNDFVYSGKDIYSPSVTIEINGHQYSFSGTRDIRTLYFLGDRFLWQIGDNEVEFVEEKTKAIDGATLATSSYDIEVDLAVKSLFPFSKYAYITQAETYIETGNPNPEDYHQPSNSTNEQTSDIDDSSLSVDNPSLDREQKDDINDDLFA